MYATNAEAQTGGSGPLAVLVKRRARGVDHDWVFNHLAEQGSLAYRCALLTVVSAAIATLGLIRSSPAVIMGAVAAPAPDPTPARADPAQQTVHSLRDAVLFATRAIAYDPERAQRGAPCGGKRSRSSRRARARDTAARAIGCRG